MKLEAFEIATYQQIGHDKWLVSGRAYIDVNLNDRLTTLLDSHQGLLVIEIETYHKSTDILSAMMTGTLTLEGELHIHKGEDAPKFLFAGDE